jgi:dTDP-4-dehydrorhamnose 3,5-epimerase
VEVRPTALPGVVEYRPQVFGDARGFFLESFNVRRYAGEGLPDTFVQDNLSRSARGVLRGLHYQHPNAQGKLVQVLEGTVFDVAVDIRRGSPTFGRWVGVTLEAPVVNQLWIPPGFAHGFCVTSESALFLYKCTAYYDPQGDYSLRFDDPQLGIEWPVAEPVLSDKDRNAPTLAEAAPEHLPAYEP